MKQRTFFGRFAIPILLLIGAVAPFVVYSAAVTVKSNSNRVQDWLPKSFVETGDLAYFREHFLGDQFVLISWEGCKLGGDPRDPDAEPDDPRIEKLVQALVPDPASGKTLPADSKLHYFKAVTTGRHLMNQLTNPPMELSHAEALKRLQGLVIGPDGRQTCVLVSLTDDASPHFRELIGRGDTRLRKSKHKPGLLFNVLEEIGVPKETVHLGGPPVDNVSIDEEGERTLVRLAFLSGGFGLLLAWWSLRSVKLTLIVFACGLFSGALGLAAVWWTGQTADAVLMSMPSMVYVLAISGAIHLINYYRDEVDERGAEGAPGRALSHGWWPTCLCSITTAFGLLSLCASDLTPIRKFGAYSALGLLMALSVLFLYLPAALTIWPMKNRKRPTEDEAREAARKAATQKKVKRDYHAVLDAFWRRFGTFVIRRNGMVTAICLIVIAALAGGIYRTRTSINLLELFDGNARILKDYRWLEQNVGRLVPMEIVIKFRDGAQVEHDKRLPNDHRYTLQDRMAVVSTIQGLIEERFGPNGEKIIGPSLSAATFVPEITPGGKGISVTARDAVTNKLLKQNYEQLVEAGYLRVDKSDNSELWRISLRVAAFQNVDYGVFADEVRSLVIPVTEHYSRAWPKTDGPMVSAIFTGVVPIVYKAQRALLDSLIQSTVWSFLTITPLLMFVCRSIGGGLVAMIPNVLPILVVFGGMAWIDYPVSIGSMMAASIALGVAVDDTIHYLTWFRADLNDSMDRNSAILVAYRRCGTPTLQAALVNGVGLSVFAVSTFTPTREFGLLMLTIMLAGGVAELVMMPALLAGPLGGVFEPGPSRAASFWAALRGEIAPTPVPHAVPNATTTREIRAVAE